VPESCALLFWGGVSLPPPPPLLHAAMLASITAITAKTMNRFIHASFFDQIFLPDTPAQTRMNASCDGTLSIL
jgi:hypothetical protein